MLDNANANKHVAFSFKFIHGKKTKKTTGSSNGGIEVRQIQWKSEIMVSYMKQALLIIAAHDVMPLDFINRTHLDPFIPLPKLWEQFKSYKYEHFPTQIREILRS